MFEINTYFLSSNSFPETCMVYEIMWQYGAAVQATEDNKVFARCMMEE